MDHAWTITLFGGLRVCGAGQELSRFRTQKTAALLARLAYPPLRPHAREELIGWLWPDADEDGGRGSLRVALNSLRHQLEPPPVPAGSVLRADRSHVGLNPAVVATDVGSWEDCLRAAAIFAPGTPERSALQEKALTHYGGPLLPGFYDDWVLAERERLTESYVATLLELAAADPPEARLDYALRAVAADPLREEAHAQVIRLHRQAGRDGEARRQYAACERLLAEELDTHPGPLLTELMGGCAPVPSSKLARPDVPPVEPLPAVTPSAAPQPIPTLPATFTRFCGRRTELAEVTAYLLGPGTRVLTLTGPGGTGKTRLAVEAARRCRDVGARTVFFVPLADLTDPALLTGALLTALGLPPAVGPDPWARVVAPLSESPSLLVLDNLEQILDAGAALVARLVESVPDLICLVTSRRRLGLEAEREYPVPPLDLPDGDCPAAALGRVDSVALFVDRAQEARPDFQLTDANAAAVAELVRRLEGLPLALELAAARARALTPRQMLAQLSRRFEFLVSRRRLGPERHTSLWAALDWSYRLLSTDQQRFFRGLSVFRGGWNVEAAETVCGDPQALDGLEQLQDCSLVQAAEAGDAMRFRLLDSVREFGRERWTPAEAEDLPRRHARWCLALVEGGEPPDLTAEADNLRAALDWSEAGTEAIRREAGLRLAGALDSFWLHQGGVIEGRRRTETALGHSDGAPVIVRAALHGVAGRLAMFANDFVPARAHLEQALTLRRSLGDDAPTAEVCRRLASLCQLQEGEAAARVLFDEALRLRRATGDPAGIALTLGQAANAALMRGEIAAARPLFQEAVGLRRALGEPEGIACALTDFGQLASQEGDGLTARALFEESRAIYHALGRQGGVAACRNALAEIAEHRGALNEAEALAQESLEGFRAARAEVGMAQAQERLGRLAADRGRTDEARHWFAASLAIWRRLGNLCGVCRVTGAYLGGLALEWEDFGEALRLREESREMVRTSGNAWDVAVSLCDLAEVAAAQGDPARARRLRKESFAAVRHWPLGPSLAHLFHDYGRIALEEGNLEEATSLLERSQAEYRQSGLKPLEMLTLALLAETALAIGDPALADQQAQQCLHLAVEMGRHEGVSAAIDRLAASRTAQGQPRDAARLFGAVAARRGMAGYCLSPRRRRRTERLLAPARLALGPEAFAAAWADGGSLTPPAMLALAERG